jgi:SH3-like domain-containing protein
MAFADSAALNGDAIRKTLPGSMLVLDTPLGTTVPIKFAGDGFMTGEAKELAGLLGSATDKGRWWVDKDRICYKWFRWFDAEVHCLTVERDGQKISWHRDDGETGTATLTEPVRPKVQVVLEVAAPAAAHKAQPAPQPQSEAAESEAETKVISVRQVLVSPPPAQSKAAAQDSVAAPVKVAVKPVAKPMVVAMAKPVVASPKPPKAPQKNSVASKPTPTATRQPVVVAAKATAKTPPLPAFRVANVADDDVLNVRAGPSEDENIIGSIKPTAHGVQIVGNCREDWCPVKHGSLSGWANSLYLARE